MPQPEIYPAHGVGISDSHRQAFRRHHGRRVSRRYPAGDPGMHPTAAAPAQLPYHPGRHQPPDTYYGTDR